LNDSKGTLGNRKDRHEHVGKGGIGLSGFAHILNDPRFAGVPMIIETDKSDDMHEDVENLAVLRGLLERGLTASAPAGSREPAGATCLNALLLRCRALGVDLLLESTL
jgi:hypothetical protein